MHKQRTQVVYQARIQPLSVITRSRNGAIRGVVSWRGGRGRGIPPRQQRGMGEQGRREGGAGGAADPGARR